MFIEVIFLVYELHFFFLLNHLVSISIITLIYIRFGFLFGESFTRTLEIELIIRIECATLHSIHNTHLERPISHFFGKTNPNSVDRVLTEFNSYSMVKA